MNGTSKQFKLIIEMFCLSVLLPIKFLVLEPVYFMGKSGGLEIKFVWHVLYCVTQDFSLVNLWLIRAFDMLCHFSYRGIMFN